MLDLEKRYVENLSDTFTINTMYNLKYDIICRVTDKLNEMNMSDVDIVLGEFEYGSIILNKKIGYIKIKDAFDVDFLSSMLHKKLIVGENDLLSADFLALYNWAVYKSVEFRDNLSLNELYSFAIQRRYIRCTIPIGYKQMYKNITAHQTHYIFLANQSKRNKCNLCVYLHLDDIHSKYSLEEYKNKVIAYMSTAYNLTNTPDIYTSGSDKEGLVIVFKDITTKHIGEIKTLLKIMNQRTLLLMPLKNYD